MNIQHHKLELSTMQPHNETSIYNLECSTMQPANENSASQLGMQQNTAK